MNNKGFALSGMLYTILAIFVLLVVGLLTMFNSRKTILDKLKKKVLDETSNIYEIYNFKTAGNYEINITKTGYYEIELPSNFSGEKTIRINAENFSGEYVVENFENTKNIYEKNIMLKPYTTKINGVVTFGKGQALGNTLVMIEFRDKNNDGKEDKILNYYQRK